MVKPSTRIDFEIRDLTTVESLIEYVDDWVRWEADCPYAIWLAMPDQWVEISRSLHTLGKFDAARAVFKAHEKYLTITGGNENETATDY